MIENLHFLRPEWFFAFAPLVLFSVIMFRRHSTSISWKAICDERLLPHVLTRGNNKTSRFPLWLVIIATSLSIVAAAGPVWKKLPQPVFREQSALVILVDLSRSMDATDLKPSRIERAKLKILDILNNRKGGQTALIVYAADAFVVTPLTNDAETIANLVPTLATELMPAQGSRAGTAMEKAAMLLKQAGASKGEILLITDGISKNTTRYIHDLVKSGHRLSVMGVGTNDGSPIPVKGGFLQDVNGAIVIPKLQTQQLHEAARTGEGIYTRLQSDDSDIDQLIRLYNSKKTGAEIEDTQLTADIWQEEGPWLLLLVLPFAALWPRKGWLLALPYLVSTTLFFPEAAHAIDTKNLWSSADQKAMRSFENGDAVGAAELFQNNRWKSSAYYRAKNYEQSINTLKKPTSSDDFYNKGNALAKLGRYPEAISAYDEALNLDENNEDANFNRELVKKKLEQQDKQKDGEQQDKDQQDNQSSDKNNESDKQSDQDDQANKNDAEDQQSQNNENSSQKQDQGASEDEKQNAEDKQQAEKNTETGENQDKDDEDPENNQAMSSSETNEMSEDEQVTEQWLKRIPDDPGGLLRRKFMHQYKRMPHKADNQPW